MIDNLIEFYNDSQQHLSVSTVMLVLQCTKN